MFRLPELSAGPTILFVLAIQGVVVAWILVDIQLGFLGPAEPSSDNFEKLHVS